MTLTRINRIKNYRIFRDLTWPQGLHDFGRFNVIYGLNGVGKTTLASLLRSAEKKISIHDSEVELVFGDKTVKGSDFAAGAISNIRVFNRDFVDRSVFESSDTQFPPVFYFGEDSAAQQREIARLEEELTGKDNARENLVKDAHRASQEFEEFCSDTAKNIRQLLTAPGSSYNNYDARGFKRDIQKISEINPVPAQLSASERDNHLRIRESKRLPQVEQIAGNFPDLAGLKKRTEEALRLSVISHRINDLVNDRALAKWVEEGLVLHRHETSTALCHFCEQPLMPERLQRLEEHFNDEFNRQKEMIGTLLQEIDAATHFSEAMAAPPPEALYESIRAEYSAALTDLRSHSNTLKGALKALKDSLVLKLERPFQPMELKNSLQELDGGKGVGGLILSFLSVVAESAPLLAAISGPACLKRTNSAIRRHNELTISFESSIQNARDSLARDEVIAVLGGWVQRKSAIAETENAASESANAVITIKKRIETLAGLVQQHHRPADELTRELSMYLGRSELKFLAEKNGYRMLRGDQVAQHLSEGERTAVAFMYFLKSLQGTDFDLKKGIVVIDDPVSSLDANSLFSAFGFTKERTEDVQQLILLTHNFTFFRQVRNWFDSLNKRDRKTRPARFFALSSTIQNGQRGASLEMLDPLLTDFESEYHYLFKRVLELTQLAPGTHLEQYYGIANMARRLLEAFLAYRVPGYSGELYKKFQTLQGDASTKTRVLRFLHTFSHGDAIAQPEFDPGILSETHAVLGDVLDLIALNDHQHYVAMVDLCGPSN